MENNQIIPDITAQEGFSLLISRLEETHSPHQDHHESAIEFAIQQAQNATQKQINNLFLSIHPRAARRKDYHILIQQIQQHIQGIFPSNTETLLRVWIPFNAYINYIKNYPETPEWIFHNYLLYSFIKTSINIPKADLITWFNQFTGYDEFIQSLGYLGIDETSFDPYTNRRSNYYPTFRVDLNNYTSHLETLQITRPLERLLEPTRTKNTDQFAYLKTQQIIILHYLLNPEPETIPNPPTPVETTSLAQTTIQPQQIETLHPSKLSEAEKQQQIIEKNKFLINEIVELTLQIVAQQEALGSTSEDTVLMLRLSIRSILNGTSLSTQEKNILLPEIQKIFSAKVIQE